MAKKRDINVFNVSFLDLLSGALGAVLILFVIVPKMDSQIRQKLQELETFKELQMDVTQIQGMITTLQGSVPKATIDNLQSNLNNLSTDLKTLQSQVKQLQDQLAKAESERIQSVEKSKKLQEEVDVMKSQMKDTNKLVVENKKLKSELEILKKNQASSLSELEALKLQQTDVSAAQAKIQKQLDAQKSDLFKCLEDKKALDDALAEMRAKIEELLTKNKKMSQELSKNTNDKKYVETAVEKMVEQVESMEKENNQLKKQNDQLKKQLENAQNELAKQDKENQGGTKESRTGVKFNDKNIVFVVDVSGSMDDDPEPEKLDQVKAGLKMLVASMDESYKIDILIFPKSPTVDYDGLYNRLAPVSEKQKYAIYRHLAPIYARNCTPTRSVLEHVLTSPAYKDAGTITFLSDGLPTQSIAGSTECPEDPPKEVLSYVKKLNTSKKVINTIGVGKVYRNSASKDPKVTFMKSMAKQNGGFYIGF